MAMIAAVAAAVIGVVEVQSAPRCTDAVSFRYCGEHLSRLPLTVRLNNAGKPSTLGGNSVAAATRDAIDVWNRAWPKVLLTGNGLRVEAGSCSPLCYGGTTTTAVAGVMDTVSTIGWGDPSDCDGSHAERVAVACLWYEDAAKTKIKEVDIILNVSKAWRLTDPMGELVLGEVQGSVPVRDVLLEDANWYDVQAALTHELGHALGLEDIGDEVRKWPGNFEDALKHTQTMYRWYMQGSTNKRTLGEGDVIGLSMAAMDTAKDA